MLFPASVTLPLAALVAAGGATALVLHSSNHGTHPTSRHVAHGTQLQASRAAIAHIGSAQARADAVARRARKQYRSEVSGSFERSTARRAAADPALLAALRSGTAGRASAIAAGLLYRRDHISHIEIVRRGRSVVSVGKGFVSGAAPVRVQGDTMYVSIQDVIGFVRLLHRRTGADVVVRGRPGHVATSLAGATRASLPAGGPATVGGARYHVSSFSATGLLGERLHIWVLARG
jgi:hypothetical protein